MTRCLPTRLLTGTLVALPLVAGCATSGPLGLLRAPSPYESYVGTLERSGLADTALGRDWLGAGALALDQASRASVPFRETGYFAPDAPAAAAYRMTLSRGRQLHVEVAFDSAAPARLFVDLLALREGDAPRLLASLEDGATTLTHDIDRDGDYLLRIQPELLRGGRYTLIERTLSTLAFPVAGLTARAVQSGFGAARDGGTRGHEGVDVFASRGTAVTAVVDGMAHTSTNNLGGNVVWLRDGRAGRTYYYAHLDRWAFEGTTQVRAGDVLGYVGNTGNARTTAPHLHFGVYEGRAIDPLPFLQPDDPMPAEPTVPLERLGQRVRVVPVRTPLREGAEPRATPRVQLPRATLARVVGVSGSMVRVVLDDDSVGYLAAQAVTPADTPLRRARLAPGTLVRERSTPDAPVVDVVGQVLAVDVLGQSGGYTYVRGADGAAGWVALP